MTSQITNPRIGIALGGGSARGLVHIPFIEAMDELGLRPSLIAGTSIGALIGAGWASGMPGKIIREHTIEVLGSMRSITGRIWARRIRDIRKLIQGGLSMQFDANEVVDAFAPMHFPETFQELRIPLNIIATDFGSWHQVIFHAGPLKPAIACSIAIPSLFRPVQYQGRVLVDGGVVNPLPLDSASADTDILIGIDVNGEPARMPNGRAPSAIDVAMGSAQIMMHQLTAHMMAAFPPDIYLRPHVQEFSAYEYWRVREIIAAGDLDKERFKRLLAKKVEEFIDGQQRSVSAIRMPRSH